MPLRREAVEVVPLELRERHRVVGVEQVGARDPRLRVGGPPHGRVVAVCLVVGADPVDVGARILGGALEELPQRALALLAGGRDRDEERVRLADHPRQHRVAHRVVLVDVVLVDDDDLAVDALRRAGVVGDRVDALPGLLDDDLVGAHLAGGAQHRVGVDHAAELVEDDLRLGAVARHDDVLALDDRLDEGDRQDERRRQARLAGVARQPQHGLAVLAHAAPVDAAEDRPQDAGRAARARARTACRRSRGRGAG